MNTRIDELLFRIVKDIKEMTEIEKLVIKKETARLNIDKGGVTALKVGEEWSNKMAVATLPDIVRILSEGTGLPRANIGKILKDSGRLKDFINNPHKFTEQVIKIISFHQSTMSIEGIVYTKINGQEYSLYEVFGDADENEAMQYLSNTVAVEKSIYSHVTFDGTEYGVESTFAEDLEADPNVVFFFKIPSGFKIDTPVGKYGPDWAVYYKVGDDVKMFFVIETKGSTDRQDLRIEEDIKVYCGRKHFEGIKTEAK